MGNNHFRPCFVVAFLMIFLFAASWAASVAVAQDGTGDVPATQASPPATPPPIVPVTTTDPSGFMLLMGSVAGIVSLTIGLTAAVKRGLENTPIGDKLPNWIIVLSLAAVMTLLARFVLKSISGDPVQLVFGVLFNTGLSAGVFSLWDGRKTTPTTSADSREADKASAGVLTKGFILLFALGVGLSAAGCKATPLRQYDDEQVIFTSTVNILNGLKRDKKIDAKTWHEIVVPLIDQGDALMDKIKVASAAGQTLQVADYLDELRVVLSRMAPLLASKVTGASYERSPDRGLSAGRVGFVRTSYREREGEGGRPRSASAGESREAAEGSGSRGSRAGYVGNRAARRRPADDVGERFLDWRVIERLERRVAA